MTCRHGTHGVQVMSTYRSGSFHLQDSQPPKYTWASIPARFIERLIASLPTSLAAWRIRVAWNRSGAARGPSASLAIDWRQVGCVAGVRVKQTHKGGKRG